MFQRLINISKSNSFFIFGARGTGKTTWIRGQKILEKAPFFDFLKPEIEDIYARDPGIFAKEILSKSPTPKWVILDEVQRVPRLLDAVHSLIESHKIKFVLTGSSARKLKRGGANLLAGRAFVHHLYPFTALELGDRFDINDALAWGSLPQISKIVSSGDKTAFLRAYALTYLKEEIQMEQIVRRLDPFRNFLEIAAVMNGQILNYNKIAKDVGCDIKTVQSYYEVLQDTWLGFYLPAYHLSVRKSQRQHPKFYLFDTGVKRALERSLDGALSRGTSAYGEAFEHWVVLEAFRLNEYFTRDYKLSYYQTHQGAEIDLILSKPGKSPVVIEIKSSTKTDQTKIDKLAGLAKELKSTRAYYLSQCEQRFVDGGVTCCHWLEGLKEIFKVPDKKIILS